MNPQGNETANHPPTDHQLWLAARDVLVRQVGCPACKSAGGLACIGSMGGGFAGLELAFHHYERLAAAFPGVALTAA